MTRDRLVIAGYLLLAALMLPGLFLLRQDNSPQAFFVADDQALTEFRELEAWFGPARGLRVVLQGPGLWSVESLAWLAEIEAGLEGMQEVMGVASVVRHHRWRLDAWPPPDPAAFRALVLSDPLDRDMGWVSADGEVLTLLVGLYRLEPAPQSGLLARIEALLARPPPGIETSLAGLPAVNRALDREMLQMALVFFPLLGLLAVLLLTLCYRGPREVALPMLFVIACQVPVFGAMGYLGVRINLVLIVLVPLLFVIALATAVHLLGYQRRLRRRGLGWWQRVAIPTG